MKNKLWDTRHTPIRRGIQFEQAPLRDGMQFEQTPPRDVNSDAAGFENHNRYDI
jgi:hypothetical protein